MADQLTQRQSLRRQMLAAFAEHHRRRLQRRRVAASVAAAALIACVAWSISVRPAPPAPRLADAPQTGCVQIVRGSPCSGLIRSMSDEELVSRLEAIGRPAGLVRVEGRVLLTSAVTDAAREAPPL